MRTILGTILTVVASLAGGIIGGLLAMPVGLILHDVVSWLLVLAVAGVFAALAAAWAGTLLNWAGEGVELKPVLIGTEVVALGLWIVRVSPLGAALARALETNLAFVTVCAVVLGASAGSLAIQSRRGQRRLGRLTGTTLRLIGAVVLAVPTVVYFASLFGLVGA
jgi:hypothetical protein